MKKIKTVREIKLLRKSLKYQLEIHQDRMKLQSADMMYDCKKWIVQSVVERSLYSILSYFINRKK